MPKVQELKTKRGSTFTTSIPKEIVEALKIKKGDIVQFRIIGGEYKDGELIDPKIEFRKLI
ncbi:MAG: AbrB/MazE/SpoVT family DNA-binding domain-containing protein [Promethearchaeota archaeon]